MICLSPFFSKFTPRTLYIHMCSETIILLIKVLAVFIVHQQILLQSRKTVYRHGAFNFSMRKRVLKTYQPGFNSYSTYYYTINLTKPYIPVHFKPISMFYSRITRIYCSKYLYLYRWPIVLLNWYKWKWNFLKILSL